MKRGDFASTLIEAGSRPVIPSQTGGLDEVAPNRGLYLLTSGYSAANGSPNRGYVYWPSTRGRVELSSLTIQEIQRRVRWLYANFGFCRRIILGMSKMIGTVTPYPNTGDDDWDDLVYRNLMERAGSEEVFDASGKFDLWSAQFQMDVDRFKDGDLLVVPTSPDGYDGLQLMFYEGPQIRDERSSLYGSTVGPRGKLDFHAGVLTDHLDKHLAYRIQSGVDPSRYATIARKTAYYYAHLESHRAIRGISILAHAVVNMIDVIETRSFTKKRLKENASKGMIVEQDNRYGIVEQGGFGGPILTSLQALPDGSEVEVNWEMVMAGGHVPRLNPGEKVKIVADDRPTDNAREFERDLLRDAVEGTGLPYQALLDISAIKGPGIRYTMGEIRRWVADHLRYKAKFVRWYCSLHVANEIEAGRLPRPKADAKDPNWWHRFEYIGQADPTIDEGRQGNLCVVNLQNGLTHWGIEWGAKGHFWKHAVRSAIAQRKWAQDECDRQRVPFQIVFPGLANAIPTAEPAPPGDEPRKTA